MTSEDLHNYLIPALTSLWGLNGAQADYAEKLDGLLHRAEFWLYWHRQNLDPISDSYRTELAALNSSHAWTILKMIRIKKGLSNDGLDAEVQFPR